MAITFDHFPARSCSFGKAKKYPAVMQIQTEAVLGIVVCRAHCAIAIQDPHCFTPTLMFILTSRMQTPDQSAIGSIQKSISYLSELKSPRDRPGHWWRAGGRAGGGRPSQWGRRQKLRPAPCLSFYADDGVIDLCFCVFSFGRFLVGYLSICSWNFVSHIFSYCLHIVTFRK